MRANLMNIFTWAKYLLMRASMDNGAAPFFRANIRAVDVNESFKQKKTLPTVSSNIESDRTGTTRRNNTEVHFRVPTLYPSNDGLHLLTSDKNGRQTSDKR